jgi:hypothetical protein
MLSQNIEVALNGMNPWHNIQHKQIVQEHGLANDTFNPNFDPVEEPAPPHNPHHKCLNI